MAGYLSNFCEIVDQLAGVGITINDELRAIVLLSSLPVEYENFVVAIETRDSLPTFEILCIKLKEEGERRENTERHTENSTAFSAAQKCAKLATKKKQRSVVCYKCGEKGHIKANCRKAANSNNEDGKAVSVTGGKQQFSLLNALDGSSFEKFKWILDE
jgi:hypothetical protein